MMRVSGRKSSKKARKKKLGVADLMQQDFCPNWVFYGRSASKRVRSQWGEKVSGRISRERQNEEWLLQMYVGR